jgi:Niemann-Pick C1 protein
MCCFTCFVFYKKHKVKSRSLLGVSAVVSVLLSIATAYGLLFIFGVPFTSITQMLPFILFGIGLDDAFIIMGSFVRTDQKKHIEERVWEAVDDAGVSITLTTLTSAFAFALGCTSSVPAVYWVCLYAFPSVIMVYFYQLTFFVACISLDQKRIDEQRRDCCTWITVPAKEEVEEIGEEQTEQDSIDDAVQEEFKADTLMNKYAEILLRPWMKLVVIIGFIVLAVFCAISASKLRQEFKFKDVLPGDSYITTFIDARQDYSSRSHILNGIYFRNEDQSDEDIQQQMFDYIDQLVEMESVTGYPDFFWLRDLNRFVENQTLHYLPFYTQLDLFLGVDIINEVYGGDIIRDEDGKIIESRCFIDMGNVEADDIKGQIQILDDARRIGASQPINQGKEEASFLTYSRAYNIWEFYSIAVGELIFAAIVGVAAVTAIAFLLIPHWTAALYVLPLMCVLYVDILGVMQWGGVTINPVSYVALAMSVGLLVDFIMHVLLKFYELPGNRVEKTIVMLRTMGSSIFLGGLTTLLGTVPLVFSASEIFYTIFIGFMGLVTLGVGHGLILLPVILSMVGTNERASAAVTKKASTDETVKKDGFDLLE